MKLRRPAPPYNESPGDGRCFECCIKSCIEHFEPDCGITFDDVDRLTGKLPGMGTWPMRGFVAMARRGYEVVVYEAFDYPAFIEDPERYLTETSGPEAAKLFCETSSIDRAIEDAQELLRAEPDLPNLTRNTTPPTQQDLERLIDDGYLCICDVDVSMWELADRVMSHAILAYDYDEFQLFDVDPARPPKGEGWPAWENFNYMWSSPSDASKLLFAMRKPRDDIKRRAAILD